jgi:hypothetical protein
MSAPGPPHFYHNTSLDLDAILEALPMNFESIQMTSKEHHLPPCKKHKLTFTINSTKLLSLPKITKSTYHGPLADTKRYFKDFGLQYPPRSYMADIMTKLAIVTMSQPQCRFQEL